MPRPKQGGHGRNRRRRSEITIGVVCGHASEREALVSALGDAGGVRALDCGTGNAESVTRVRDLGIEIVLVGLDPGPAASFTAALRSAVPGIRAVVLLRSESEGALARLAAAGVVGFVRFGAGLSACVRTLRAVRSRGFSCPPEIAAEVLRAREAHGGGSRSERSGAAGLRGRPLQVAECVAEGLSNKEISARLLIAEGTVKSHVHAVLKALGVEHRWEVRGALQALPVKLTIVRTKNGPEGG